MALFFMYHLLITCFTTPYFSILKIQNILARQLKACLQQLSSLFTRVLFAPLALVALLAACSPVDEQGTASISSDDSNAAAALITSHDSSSNNIATDVPNFASFTDVNNKKAAFFSYLQPAYDLISQEILAKRQQLQAWQKRVGQLTEAEKQQLTELAAFYKTSGTDDSDLIVNLLQHIDVIPEALVFSQAANESGWGTSRFARQGYNFFGQWCFSRGCGFVPSQRDADAIHEVAKFDSLAASMRSYHRNINRNTRYQPLRSLREQQRQDNQAFDACAWAQGLEGYSERKQDYVDELRNMMRQNRQYWRDNQVIDYKQCITPEI